MNYRHFFIFIFFIAYFLPQSSLAQERYAGVLYREIPGTERTGTAVTVSPEFKRRYLGVAQERLGLFLTYISFVGSGEFSRGLKNRYIDRSLQLFYKGAYNTMELSSKYHNRKWSKDMDIYLARLRDVNYYHQEIESYIAPNVTEIKRQPDGTYRGTLTYIQLYKSYDKNAEGQKIERYSDMTKKTVEIIIVRSSQIARSGWLVYLGDVFVEETSEIFNVIAND